MSIEKQAVLAIWLSIVLIFDACLISHVCVELNTYGFSKKLIIPIAILVIQFIIFTFYIFAVL